MILGVLFLYCKFGSDTIRHTWKRAVNIVTLSVAENTATHVREREQAAHGQ
jgi:hypothetical protein